MDDSDTPHHQRLVDHLKCEMGNAIEVYHRTADSVGIKVLSRKQETVEILAESIGYSCEREAIVTNETDTVTWEYAKIACSEAGQE